MQANIHAGMSFHFALDSSLRLPLRNLDERRPQEHAKEDHQQDDHNRTARELSQSELPAHQHCQQNAEFQNKIRGGELEDHSRCEVRSFFEHGTSQRNSGIGT